MENEKVCLCGSGKQYIDCCANKIQLDGSEKSRRIHMSDLINARKLAGKYCIHPNKSECSNEIIGAHNIQENGILNKLQHDNHILMPIYKGFESKLILESLGTATEATVFTGFCSTHDREVFRKIEYPKDYPFIKSDEQLFLYAYKAFAFTYYKVNREYKCSEILSEKYDYNNMPHLILFHEIVKLNKLRLDNEKTNFDKALMSKKYCNMIHICGELNYEVKFAVSTSFVLKYDFYGNEIFEDTYDKGIPLVYITIFPADGKSHFILSWFKQYNKYYSKYKKQFEILPQHLILKYLNNLLILNAENIVLSPYLWDSWTENQKAEFLSISETILRDDSYKDDSAVYFQMRGFNLFDKI